jgi:peptide/nickel transport system ATP-binding protein
MTAPALRVRGLTVTLDTAQGSLRAADRVAFDLPAGQAVGLVGESGSGKTTVLRALLGLPPRGSTVAGSVRLGGRELLGLPDRELASLRGTQVAMIFQDPATTLNPIRRVGSQIGEGPRVRLGWSRARARDHTIGLLRLMEVADPERVVRSYPHQLSGGIRQRVMIATALACRPAVLLCDEPTSALDVTTQEQILALLRTAAGLTGSALVLVSHDLAVVGRLCSSVLVMYAGRIVERGPVDEVFADPRHPYTRALLRSRPAATGERTRPVPVPGEPPDRFRPPSGCRFRTRCVLAEKRCASLPYHLTPVAPRLTAARLDATAPLRAAACIHATAPLLRAIGDTPHPGTIGDTPHPGTTGDTPHPGTTGDTPHAEAVRRTDAGGRVSRLAGAGTPVLEVRGLGMEFPGTPTGRHFARRPRLRAVDGVDLHLDRAEILGLVGESGCGKSTMARCIVGLHQPTDGQVLVDGRPMPRHRTASERRRLQLVFQDPAAALNPARRIGGMLAELLRVHGLATRREVRPRCVELLRSVGLDASFLGAYPHALSGGQQQRVSLARALALEPAAIIADEIISALDVSVQASVLNLLVDLRERLDVAILFISHDLAVVRQICDRVAVMHRGRIVEVARVDAVFSRPRHPHTRRLLAAIPTLPPARRTPA